MPLFLCAFSLCVCVLLRQRGCLLQEVRSSSGHPPGKMPVIHISKLSALISFVIAAAILKLLLLAYASLLSCINRSSKISNGRANSYS